MVASPVSPAVLRSRKKQEVDSPLEPYLCWHLSGSPVTSRLVRNSISVSKHQAYGDLLQQPPKIDRVPRPRFKSSMPGLALWHGHVLGILAALDPRPHRKVTARITLGNVFKYLIHCLARSCHHILQKFMKS